MKSHIIKLLNNTITKQELIELDEWINDTNNKFVLESYIKDQHDLNLATLKTDLNKAFKAIENQINTNKPIPIYKKGWFKYAAAACLIALLSLPVVLNKKNNTTLPKTKISQTKNTINIGSNKATLTLENGTNINLEENKNYTSNHIKNNGKKLTYSSKKASTEVTYNYLTIPRGGQYFVELSDGTQVWLNSETQLKYPVSFPKQGSRTVELVYGEAYFDVSESNKHNGQNFKVLTNIQEVEVLGTEFNIKAYKDETHIYTTLVEGKVSVKNSNYKETLKPNEQSILDTSSKNFVITTADTTSEIAWKRGLFSFKNKPLKDIMKVLSRWYNVNIIFVDKNLENVMFKGVVSRNQNIEDILDLIKNTNYINTYEINNNTIFLKE